MIDMVATGLALVAGGFLVIDALAKANDLPFTVEIFGTLTGHRKIALPAVIALGLIEAGLGGAALIGEPIAKVTAAVFLIVVSVAALVLAKRTGDADCGCHGRAVKMTPTQSVILAVVVAAALGISLAIAPVSSVSISLLASGSLAMMLIWTAIVLYGWKFGPLVDFTPLKRGARFDVDHLLRVHGATNLPVWTRGDMIVLAAAGGCHVCHAWMRVLAAASHLPDMPPLLVLLADAEADHHPVVAASATTHVLAVPASDLFRLARRTPMAGIVRGGVVVEVWDKVIPEAITGRLRKA